MSLMKREPSFLRGVEPLLFDRFLEPLWPSVYTQSRAEDGPVAPRVDITEKDDVYLVEADLPGMTKDNINLSMEGSVLTIKAEMTREEKKESDQMICHERFNQQYLRRLDLGANASAKGISAEFNNGVLTVKVPKVNEKTEKPVKIKVK
jgi:HSP20 family protein